MMTMADHVREITQDMFTALVDGEPGHLAEWDGEAAELAEPVHAWVDVQRADPVRALVTTEQATAERITRALLAIGPDEAVATTDLDDALGEMANVIGGNLKGLMTDSGALTLPVVAHGPADMVGALAWECRLQWHTAPFIVSMWNLEPNLDGKGPAS